MTVIKWLGTTAIALAIGTGGVIAQSQRDLPQKGEDSPRVQSPKDADRPAATEQRPTDRAKDRAAQPEPKAGAKDTLRGEDKSAPERRQAQEPTQSRDSKQPAKQTQDQPARGERPPASTTQQTQDQKGRDAKQPADQRQQQTRDQQQKQDTQARDAKQPADSTRQQSGQTTQPSGTRPADTAQDGQRPAAGQATDQTTQRGQTASTTVNDQQRTQIIEKLRSDRTAARAPQNLNIQVNIGQTLPPRVRPRPLPADIVRITPQYRGYEYTVVEDEIVIVEPRSRRVVDVISERGPAQTAARTGQQRMVVLTQEQRESFRQVARRTTTGSTSPSGSVADTSCLTLQPVPEDLVRANPQLESYRYLAIGEQIVLIDPREQKVVEVVD